MSCDCEMPTVYSETHPRSRKRRRCCECHGWIEIGETYERISGCWDGHFSDYTTCDQCAQLRRDYSKTIDCCVGLGSLHEEMLEHTYYQSDDLTFPNRFEDIRIRRGATICPLFHAEENELPIP